MRALRPWAFWPPFLVLLASAAWGLLDGRGFLAATSRLNGWLLDRFGTLYAISALLFLALCAIAALSPLGRVRIGGEGAVPLLDRRRWFAITLCTTVAIGILFWGAAEPISHLHHPPPFAEAEPGSPAAARFALSTMYLHWSFTPYAMYSLAAMMFALQYYNRGQPFSLGSMLAPVLGRHAHGLFGSAIDAICLYSLVAGMAASLGAGLLTLGAGLNATLGIPNGPPLLAALAFLICGAFVGSAASGLLRGIRALSEWNLRVFVAIVVFVLITGPTRYIVSEGLLAFGDYIGHFLPRSLAVGAAAGDPWPRDWTLFYWANWLAWTPVTALFLGRLAYGYTVRDLLLINLLAPALFSCAWMATFSGAALATDLAGTGAPLGAALAAGGPETVMFSLLERLPLAGISTGLFLLAASLSYVTAADSNTAAMSAISATGISPDTPEAPARLKLAWGLVVGTLAWVMVTFSGIDGVRMASNLGGFPALFLVLGVAAGMVRLILRPGLAVRPDPPG
ncbi:MAG TPA: BCCT family transporter [Thermoanaerobaculia bacterium]|nr:BCCT family transporter [Thermoanaerobaculia bacterium]